MITKEKVLDDVVGLINGKDPDTLRKLKEQELIALAKKPITRGSIVRGWALFNEMNGAEWSTWTQAHKDPVPGMARSAGIVAALYGSQENWKDRHNGGIQLDNWSARKSVAGLPEDEKIVVMEFLEAMRNTRNKRELDENFPWRDEYADSIPLELVGSSV